MQYFCLVRFLPLHICRMVRVYYRTFWLILVSFQVSQCCCNRDVSSKRCHYPYVSLFVVYYVTAELSLLGTKYLIFSPLLAAVDRRFLRISSTRYIYVKLLYFIPYISEVGSKALLRLTFPIMSPPFRIDIGLWLTSLRVEIEWIHSPSFLYPWYLINDMLRPNFELNLKKCHADIPKWYNGLWCYCKQNIRQGNAYRFWYL